MDEGGVAAFYAREEGHSEFPVFGAGISDFVHGQTDGLGTCCVSGW